MPRANSAWSTACLCTPSLSSLSLIVMPCSSAKPTRLSLSAPPISWIEIRICPKSSYLDYKRLEQALAAARADAVWVGWGFVAEHAAFADLCHEMGIVFIGPSGDVMRKLGDKIAAETPGGSSRRSLSRLGATVLSNLSRMLCRMRSVWVFPSYQSYGGRRWSRYSRGALRRPTAACL